ncbi:MAG TPA: hypothetical protein VJ728_05545 [Candidatus Binataceae bacterium]|nr:hypothetical protein [Candidatus Binataceae bacterium]
MATAGDLVTYINMATADGNIEFQNDSSAGSATYRDTGVGGGSTTHINFHDQARAGTSVFNNEKSGNGVVSFHDSSTADHATITNEPNFASNVTFYNNSTERAARRSLTKAIRAFLIAPISAIAPTPVRRTITSA